MVFRNAICFVSNCQAIYVSGEIVPGTGTDQLSLRSCDHFYNTTTLAIYHEKMAKEDKTATEATQRKEPPPEVVNQPYRKVPLPRSIQSRIDNESWWDSVVDGKYVQAVVCLG